MYFTFFRAIVFLLAFNLIAPADYFILSAWSESSLASQTERFEGMGSTFKEKKQQGSSSTKGTEIEKEQSDEKDNRSSDTTISYFKLHTFVVNIKDKRVQNKLVTVTLEVFCEIKNPDDKWLVDTHIAPIKDSIITHVSGIDREAIQTQKQKKELQQQLTERVSAVLKNLTGQRVISGLYITRFIIQ